jgi:hypothetical protein
MDRRRLAIDEPSKPKSWRSQKELMGGLGLQGTKITKIKK